MDWNGEDNLADAPWQGAGEIDFDTPEGEAARRDHPWTCWPIWFSKRDAENFEGTEGEMKFDPYDYADPVEQRAAWDGHMATMMDRFDVSEIYEPANHEHIDAYRRENSREYESENFKDYPEPVLNPFSCETTEPEYIVDGVILANDATAIYGDGGSGKTTMCEQLAIAHALGTKWLGETVSGPRGKVLIMSGESDREEVAYRLQRIMSGLPGFDAADNVSKLNRFIVPYPLFDNSPALIEVSKSGKRVRTTEAYDWLESKLELHRPKIVILDSLYNFYSDDESNKPVVHQFVMLIRRLAKRYGCAILLIGHPSLSGMESGRGTSGATTWFNAFRGWVLVDADKPEDVKEGAVRVHRLKAKKAQYAAAGKTIEAYWDRGCYRHVTEGEKEERIEAAKEKFLEMLAQAVKEGRALTWKSGSALSAYNDFSKDKARKGDFTKTEFKDAMDALRAEGRIAMREYKKPDRHTGERLEVV